MGGDARAARLAEVAVGLAAGAGVGLSEDLALWHLARGRPRGVEPIASADPARALVAAMEASLSTGERRLGAHYTPPALAAEVARRALTGRGVAATVVDPACGGGALLLAAADALVLRGVPRDVVVARLFGADIDPLAVAVAEAAVALWSGGAAPPPGHLVVADGLLADAATWATAPRDGFGAVVGNPPFQGQLARATVRPRATQDALRARFGAVVAPYVDTAALFLLVAADLAAAGGRVALVQPQSTAASRDAAGVRQALTERARLVEVWAPQDLPFAARVHVCVPVLEIGTPAGNADWARHLARARGVPEVDLGVGSTVADLATAVGGFRRHYYGLVGRVRDGGEIAPLVTSGAIGLGRITWGETPIRFAKRSWVRPTVDLVAVRAAGAGLGRWLDQVLRPKVVVASQTRVMEAAADRGGAWVPCTPVVSVLPHASADVDRLAAVLCSPPVSAWAAGRASGTGLSPAAIRTSTALVLAAPLPSDADAWSAATAALAAGDLPSFAAAAIAMYDLPAARAAAVARWWETASPRGIARLAAGGGFGRFSRDIWSGPGNRVRQPGTDTQGASPASAGMWSRRRGNEVSKEEIEVVAGSAGDELRRSHVSLLPSSGAWRPGDPLAQRQLLHLGERPFALEGGGVLREVTIAYETWGTLNEARSNAVLVCHALTGDAHAAGPLLPGQPTAGWWDGMIGPGRPIDTNRWFVVCSNVLGGCQGTVGPASPHPDDGKPWGSRFPVVTVRDWVRSQAQLANHLGIDRWHSVVGGSMGGMQVLEWAVMFPDRVRSIVPIATAAAASAQQIAWWSTGRRVIRMDPGWNGGDYYDAGPGEGPHEGLALARMVSQITFRSDDVFTRRFGREVVEPLDGFSLWQRFEVERYLEYHGDKLVRRFDANSYLLLTKAMDLHDLGRGRGGVDAAMALLRAPVLAIGVQSDILYPLYQSQAIVEHARRAGIEARSVELDSPHGHDAFLIEHEQVGIPLSAFLDDMETLYA